MLRDFSQRLDRRQINSEMNRPGVNVKYRASTDLAQQQARELREMKRKQFLLIASLAAQRARALSWRHRAREGAGRGDVRRVTDELTKADADGKFTGKKALWNFLTDLIHCAAAEPRKDGSRAAVRYHGTTHKFFAMLRKLGGPRTQRFITANFGGPDEQTTRRFFCERKHDFMPGFSHVSEQATYLESVYKQKMAQLQISHNVVCEHSEDETNILQEARWNARRDGIAGT